MSNGAADTTTKDTVTANHPARGSRIAFIVLAVLLGALAFAGYYCYGRLLAPRIAGIESRLDADSGAGATARAALDAAASAEASSAAVRADIERDLKELNDRQQTLEAGVTVLQRRDTRSDIDWVLAEAEYLILAANQRLALERDVGTAQAALRAADSRLRAADHPDLIALREQLARDIGALDAVKRPDIEGMAIYLADAVGRVDALATKPIADTTPSFEHTGKQTLARDNWRDVLAAIWADLVGLVEIKDSELPDGVLFDPKLRYFLQQNLKLELSSARLAVLLRDTGNLQASLALIERQLEQYYDNTDTGVAALGSWLAEHRSTELDPAVPAIAASLDAVRSARAGLRAATGAVSGGQP